MPGKIRSLELRGAWVVKDVERDRQDPLAESTFQTIRRVAAAHHSNGIDLGRQALCQELTKQLRSRQAIHEDWSRVVFQDRRLHRLAKAIRQFLHVRDNGI